MSAAATIRECGIALAVTAAAGLARWALDPWLGEHLPYVTFFISVAIIAWLTSFGVTLASIIAGWVLADFFFVPPRGQFIIYSEDPRFVVGTLTYFMVTAAMLLTAEGMHRARRRAEQSSGRLAEVVGSLTDAFYTLDSRWRFSFVNEEIVRRFGKPRQQIIGGHIWEMFPEAVGSAAHVQQQRAMSQRVSVEYEVFYEPWQRWFHDKVHPTRDGGLAVYSQDITARKAVEQALRQSEARKGAILESALDCVITMDHEGRVVDFNPAAERTFGYSRQEAIGRAVAELIIPEPLREAHWKGLSRYLATGEAVVLGRRIEVEAQRSDGSQIPVELAIVAVQGEGGRPFFTAYVRDISKRREAEERLHQSIDAERAARAEAERASRMKDDFLAVLSHELRTPLNAILGWSQLLQSGKGGAEDLRHGIETIERNARVQAQLIEDLLDISRITSGKVRLDVQPVVLAEVIESALESIRPAAVAKGIRVQKVLDPLAGPVSGDPARLQQVVWNLVSNAVKFTPKGGKLQVRLERVNSHVEITVSDTGEGIAPEFLPHVFERFRQADQSSTRRYGGMGLGLAIVKQLVEMHGGSVHVKSPGLGQGATFVVALPVAVVHPPEEQEGRRHPRAAAAGEIDGIPVLNGLRVLVVDDEPDALELIRRVLVGRGANVTTAIGAIEALDLLNKQRPHVLVSDIGMPGQDGYELIRGVRAGGLSGRDIPAVALTAFARSEDRQRALLAGYQMHIAKPVEPNELVAAVASLAGRTGGAPGASPRTQEQGG